MITKPFKVFKLTPIILTALFFITCKECPTEPEKVIPLSISAPYIETSIVWLKILSTDSTHQKSYTVIRDSLIISEGTFFGKDTIIADRFVEPNKSYTYSVQYSDEISDLLNVTTLELSSSYFDWEVLYFGERNNELHSVSIVSDDNIWVVGRMEYWGWDSLDSEYDWIRYNGLHWNGERWNILSIKPPPWTYNGPFDVVHAIDDTIVWIGINSPALYLSGQWQGMTPAPNLGWMCDIWGNSLDNTFFTYYDGGIAHYDGNKFTVMNSGTTTDLRDIDGNSERVYIAGFSTTAGYERLILEYKDGQWSKLLKSETVDGNLNIGDFGRFNAVKVLDGVAVFASAAMAAIKYYYRDQFYDGTPSQSTVLQDCYAIENMDGNAVNDLAYFTQGGEIVHYDGQHYIKIFDYSEMGYPGSVYFCSGDFKDDVICAVGDANGKGVVVIGRR